MLGSRPKNLISWSSGIIYNSQVSHVAPLAPPLPLVPSPPVSLAGSLSSHEGRTYFTEAPASPRLFVATSWCSDWGCLSWAPPDVFSCNEPHNEEPLTSLLSSACDWWPRDQPPVLQYHSALGASFAGVSLRMWNQFGFNVSINEMTCLWRRDNPAAFI